MKEKQDKEERKKMEEEDKSKKSDEEKIEKDVDFDKEDSEKEYEPAEVSLLSISPKDWEDVDLVKLTTLFCEFGRVLMLADYRNSVVWNFFTLRFLILRIRVTKN